MSSLWQDVRIAVRVGRRAPAAAIGLVVTMAAAVAGCATVFAVVNAVLWRPFPFADPNRLLHAQATDASGTHRLLSAPVWNDWNASVRDVALAAFSYADFSIVENGEPETLSGGLVSPEFLDVAGVAPVHGRGFEPSDAAGGERRVILTHSFWTRRFGADPSIVGKVVSLAGPDYLDGMDGAYRVVGVMPRHFWLFANRLDVLVPFRFSAAQNTDRNEGLIQHVIGRVPNGRSIEQGAAEIKSVATRTFARSGSADPVAAAKVEDLRTFHFGDVRARLTLLLAAAVTVLLLAALNIAALLMAQMAGRRHEFDIRLALGASRVRLIRQVVIEALVFGVTGGLFGILLGAWGITLVRSLMPVWMIDRIPGEAAAIQLDPTVAIVLVFAVLTVSVLSGLAATLLLGVARSNVSLAANRKARPRPRKSFSCVPASLDCKSYCPRRSCSRRWSSRRIIDASPRSIPRAVWSVDKELPIDGPYLASAWVANLLAGLRLSVVVGWMFAALAFMLSIAGLYGLTAHGIQQSTREIGIRKALGATDRVVTNLFARRVALVLIPALAVGMLASLGVLRVIRAEIDGLTFQGVGWLAAVCCVLFAGVCAAAVYMPLRRIRAVDPASSMRPE